MKKILLIKIGDSFAMDISPPLGVMYLASFLRRELPVDVHVLDLQLYNLTCDQVAEYAAALGPDLVGYSAVSFQAKSLFKLASKIKTRLPDSVQVAGGAFPSSQPAEALSDPSIDYCVRGEGELVLADIVRVMMGEKKIESVKGIGRRRRGEIVLSAKMEYIEDLDSLPYPAFDLAEMEAYGRYPRQGFIYKHRKYFALFTSRGCPYGCTYCHNIFGKGFRFRGSENVLGEIDVLCNKYGIGELQIADDVFNLRRDRARDILKAIAKRNYHLGLSFSSGLRADLLDAQMVDWLKEAGAFKVSMGIETANPEMQKRIRKNLDLEKARKGIELLAKKGIMTHGYFMMGFPGESRKQMKQSASFAKNSHLHSASFFFVVPFPGTRLYEESESKKKKTYVNMSASSLFDPRMSHISLSDVPSGDLRKITKRATLNFYLSPFRLWRIVRDIPNKKQLLFLLSLVVTRACFPVFLRREHEKALERKSKSLSW